jgi:hypothetical protein
MCLAERDLVRDHLPPPEPSKSPRSLPELSSAVDDDIGERVRRREGAFTEVKATKCEAGNPRAS